MVPRNAKPLTPDLPCLGSVQSDISSLVRLIPATFCRFSITVLPFRTRRRTAESRRRRPSALPPSVNKDERWRVVSSVHLQLVAYGMRSRWHVFADVP